MSRPKRHRMLNKPAVIKGLNPFGYYGKPKDPVRLFMEEYEAIRLLDYEGMTQEDAAKNMEVSRPTLTRIYESARQKVATSFAEARQILIEGGQAIFKEKWYECNGCRSRFNVPADTTGNNCPVCSNASIVSLNQNT